MSATPGYGNLFLSIGSMKAGTTWLYSLLSRHPELHFSVEKELHFFIERFAMRRRFERFRLDPPLSLARRSARVRDIYLDRIRPAKDTPEAIAAQLDGIKRYLAEPVDDAWFNNLFPHRGCDGYACDFSNLTLLLRAGEWRRLASRTERLRVVFTMRDPTERLWSHAKFTLEHSGRAEAIRQFGPEEYARLLRDPDIAAQADYARVIRTLRKALPPEDVKLLVYERIHEDRLGTLREMERFLGISPFDYPHWLFERRQAASTDVPMPEFFREIAAPIDARVRAQLTAEGVEIPVQWGSLG